ncbi:M13 family metallopeptidase [Lactobacillus hominis]|uniref:Endopeptidase O n=3 Tax=Lactobacillus hominis TaxID=1203033 RepID=I7KGN5_9LACO|nr:M13-type metalloendopeptidase [Lactobacillus hominis]KRM84659.1 neutral endopeptidase [Lactobacillus hominis DSM 23910 = CRBIP 24.179]MCT3347760.1 M13 family peptidase [Lactobacillus hominis]CCI81385.1 Endopeptidase O [Lactobacillus hominis DSM 23910 = CRBIP 24.179]
MTHFNVRGGAGDITKPDTNARVQDNLYLAVNSKWLENAKIPSDRSRTSSFDGIDLNIEKNLMQDFADFASGDKELPKVPNFGKAVALYRIANNFEKRNADGAQPIKADLSVLTDLKNFADFNLKAADLFKNGFGLPFSFYVEADMKNTKIHALHFGGAGLILPDTTTYDNPAAKDLLDVWSKQTINLLTMAGIDEAQANAYVAGALKFDEKLSKIVKSTEEWADYPAMYNPVSLADFEAKIKNFKIDYFLGEIFDKKPDRVIVTEPRYLDHFDELVNEDNFSEIKGWMITGFINSVASYLSQDFREAAFPFHKALSGQPELSSGTKQAYHLANGLFSEVVGVYYGQTYFGAEAKADVEDMIHKMIDVYEQRISANSWLSEETKKKAITKLRALILKIGYPEKIERIYDLYEVTPESEGGSLYANESQAGKVALKYNLDKLYKDVDRSVWLMPGNLVNACYDPQRNDITFPAAILQKPFYDLKQSRSLNYGGIGVVIAHEISHAFDNNGAKFDEFGNLKNWWTDQDFAEFKKRTQAEIDLFNGIEYGPVTLNGKQIVSENIADQGGLTAAVEANKGEGGDMKEVFENFARVWATKQLPESIKTQVSVDVHAPGPERANVQSQCQEEFYKAFDVKPEDGMWLDPEKRVVIW